MSIEGLKAMEIGQTYTMSENDELLRVPGGWVHMRSWNQRMSECFIPEPEEEPALTFQDFHRDLIGTLECLQQELAAIRIRMP